MPYGRTCRAAALFALPARASPFLALLDELVLLVRPNGPSPCRPNASDPSVASLLHPCRAVFRAASVWSVVVLNALP
jgi:hypothetical protein